jgi:uncharacterized protein
MTEPKFQLIYQGRDFYVPAFDIKIRGVDLPIATRKDVIEVTYNDSVDQIDTFELTVNNWDAEKRDFKYTGSRKGAGDGDHSNVFDPGQEIELWMGYFKPIAAANEQKDEPEPLRLMLVGIITSLAPSFPAAGQPTLKVRGQNALRELSKKQETAVYENLTDSEIAEKIGKRRNLKIGDLAIPVKIDAQAKDREDKREHVLQNNQYDILFLIQRAYQNGYDVLLKYESKEKRTKPFLYFGPPQVSRVMYALEWGRSLIQFQPTLSATKQVFAVTVRGWNALKKKRIEATATLDELESGCARAFQKLRNLENGIKERKEIIVDQPFRNEQEAKRYALARLESLSRDVVTGRGSTVGTPDLRAGNQIEIRELGTIFSGKYFVTSTTHTIGPSGYITEFAVRCDGRKEKN